MRRGDVEPTRVQIWGDLCILVVPSGGEMMDMAKLERGCSGYIVVY